jgi:hypothetical protein
MLQKIMFAGMMMTIAGAASATAIQAPELDPSSLVSTLTLLAGGLVLMRGSKKSNTKE